MQWVVGGSDEHLFELEDIATSHERRITPVPRRGLRIKRVVATRREGVPVALRWFAERTAKERRIAGAEGFLAGGVARLDEPGK